MTFSFAKRFVLPACLCVLCILFAPLSALADPYPANVHVTPVDETTIEVTWSDNPWAQSYRVYRNMDLAADLPETANSFLDTGLTPGMAYYYRVCSVKDGVEYSSPVEQASWAAPLNAPAITLLTASPNYAQGIIQVQIAWTAVNQATGYEVFLLEEGAGGYDQKTETIDTSAPDGLLIPSQATTYWYKVRAYEYFHFEEAGEDQYFMGPFSEPQPLVFEPIHWGAIGKLFLYEKIWPWDDPWNKEWLRELLETYADPEKWPQDAVLDSNTLVLLARHVSENSELSELEQQMMAAIHPHGLSLLLGAYQSPPDENKSSALAEQLQETSLLLKGRLPDGLDSDALQRYFGRLQDMCGLVSLSGETLNNAETSNPEFQMTSLITQDVIYSSLPHVSSLLGVGELSTDSSPVPTQVPVRKLKPNKLPDVQLPVITPMPTIKPIRITLP